MKPEVVLVFKKSKLEILQMSLSNAEFKSLSEKEDPEILSAKMLHSEHYHSLKVVEDSLKKQQFSYSKCYRADLNTEKVTNKLVLCVGGDGTVLDTSQYVTSSQVLGINSNPSTSVGSLCTATAPDLEAILCAIQNGDLRPTEILRIKTEIDGKACSRLAMNEVLFAHRNPAATSIYEIYADQEKEQQKSSGVWVGAPAGTTGALASAGGAMQALSDQKIQVKVREPYFNGIRNYSHTHFFVNKGNTLTLSSKMLNGFLYIDGPHHAHPVPLGSKIKFSVSNTPLHLFITENHLSKRNDFFLNRINS